MTEFNDVFSEKPPWILVYFFGCVFAQLICRSLLGITVQNLSLIRLIHSGSLSGEKPECCIKTGGKRLPSLSLLAH